MGWFHTNPIATIFITIRQVARYAKCDERYQHICVALVDCASSKKAAFVGVSEFEGWLPAGPWAGAGSQADAGEPRRLRIDFVAAAAAAVLGLHQSWLESPFFTGPAESAPPNDNFSFPSEYEDNVHSWIQDSSSIAGGICQLQKK